MPKTTALANAYLEWALHGTAMPVYGATLYASLHSLSPGVGGDQSTNEVVYTSYARVAVPRTVLGWLIAGAAASNVAAVLFPECTGGADTATYLGIGTDAAGAGNLLFFGQLSSPISISNQITPEVPAGDLDLTEL